jgi:hypothetical protein
MYDVAIPTSSLMPLFHTSMSRSWRQAASLSTAPSVSWHMSLIVFCWLSPHRVLERAPMKSVHYGVFPRFNFWITKDKLTYALVLLRLHACCMRTIFHRQHPHRHRRPKLDSLNVVGRVNAEIPHELRKNWYG